MSFLLPIELADTEVRPGTGARLRDASKRHALPQLFKSTEILALAREAGFRNVQAVSPRRPLPSPTSLTDRMTFGHRTNSEELLVATTSVAIIARENPHRPLG
jgi:hypothetical protein